MSAEMSRLAPLALAPFLAHVAAANPTPAMLARTAFAPLPALGWFSRTSISFPDAAPDSTIASLESHAPPPFKRISAPLSFFAAYLALRPPQSQLDLYLAQQVPPPSFLPDLPPPPFLATDRIAHTSLWIGLSPTISPLHEDPDHNILYQLAGRKVVRMLDPARGKEVLAQVRGTATGSRLRGDEMMSAEPGGERDRLEQAVWGAHEGVEAMLHEGESLLIPRGWWHAVRGVGEGDARQVTASVNWWFR